MSYMFDISNESGGRRASWEGGALEQARNERMRLARKEAGLSQAQLAKEVGVTRQTVCSIESGDYNPTLNLCKLICKRLDRTLDQLFWE